VALNSNALTTVDALRAFIADQMTAAETGRLATSALESIINEASSAIERWCGRNLLVPSADTTYSLEGFGEPTIWLPDAPIVSVTSVTFNISVLTVPASTDINTAGWFVTDESKLAGRIELDGYSTDRDLRGVTVLAKCGYSATLAATTPATYLTRYHMQALDVLRRAANTLCAGWFENRLARSSQTVEGQTVSFDSGTMPARVEELLRPFRKVEIR
jgi:hypothetical protein